MRKSNLLAIITALILVGTIIFGNIFWSNKNEAIAKKASSEYQEYQLEKKSKNTIVLPENIYILQRTDINQKSPTIYFRNIIRGDLNNLKVQVQSELGEPIKNGWVIDNSDVTLSPFTVTVNDHNTEELLSLSANVEIIPISNTDKMNLLSIGDSMTRENQYNKRVEELLPNINTLGTRTFDDGVTNGEGRGGWNINAYLTRIGHESGVDSPFLFPSDVPASKYYGNIEFWKNVCYDNPSGYDYDGFQKIAYGWNGTECKFNEEGFPINPNKDDVVVDPNYPDGAKFLQYDGNAWKIMSPQPKVEFNFSKYMERYEVVFEGEEPNIVSLLLGANDFQTTNGVNGVFMFIANINTIIDSVKEYNPNIEFIVNLPIVGNTQEVWSSQNKDGNAEQYRENMQKLGIELIKAFNGRESEGIYVNAMNVSVGIKHLDDYIHPNEEGYNIMGDALAAMIQKIRNTK